MAEMCTLLEKHGRVKAAQIAKVRGTSKEWTTICTKLQWGELRFGKQCFCNIKHRGNYKTLILLFHGNIQNGIFSTLFYEFQKSIS